MQVHRPALPPSQERLFLKDKPQQMKTIQVPKEVKLLPSKPNEKLVDVKTNKFGDVTRVKYITATPRVSFDGIRTTPAQVKMMPPRETLKRSALAPLDREGKRQRTTVDTLA